MVNVIHVFPVDDIWTHRISNGVVLCECDPYIQSIIATESNGYDEDAFMVTHNKIDVGAKLEWLSFVPWELAP